jgi:hypothetical protein
MGKWERKRNGKEKEKEKKMGSKRVNDKKDMTEIKK